MSGIPRGFEIRPLSPADSLEELTDLLHRAYSGLAQMGLRFLATHQDVEMTARRIEGRECYVALDGARLVGTVTFSDPAGTSGSPWYDRPDVASFQQFGVDPGHRGWGLGKALAAVAERRAAETGAAEIAVDTAEPAGHLIEMYTRWGYRKVETVRWQPVNYTSVILSKSLRDV